MAGKFTPFKKHASGGVVASGVVHSISSNEPDEDGNATADMVIRHEPPERPTKVKSGDGGVAGSPWHPKQETRATIPAAHSHMFPHGSKCTVHICPDEDRGGITPDDNQAGEAGAERTVARGAAAVRGKVKRAKVD